MNVKGFSDDFSKQFRNQRKRIEDEHCQNCGVLLCDDDDPTPYERGYCRGCQVTKPAGCSDRELWKEIDNLATDIDALKRLQTSLERMFRRVGTSMKMRKRKG